MNPVLIFRKYYGLYGFFFLPIIVLLIVGGLYFFFVQAKINDILTARNLITTESNKLQKLNTKLSQLSALDEDSLRTKLVKLNVALPSTKDTMGLLVGLERMALEASLSAEAIQLAPGNLSTNSATKMGGVATMEFQATFSGPFEGIKTFLAKLENGSRILAARSISLASSTRTEGILDITIPMTAYFLPLPETMGEAAEDLPQITSEDEATYQKIAGFQMYSVVPPPGATGKLDPFARF